MFDADYEKRAHVRRQILLISDESVFLLDDNAGRNLQLNLLVEVEEECSIGTKMQPVGAEVVILKLGDVVFKG